MAMLKFAEVAPPPLSLPEFSNQSECVTQRSQTPVSVDLANAGGESGAAEIALRADPAFQNQNEEAVVGLNAEKTARLVLCLA